jgi:hypothetical protein
MESPQVPHSTCVRQERTQKHQVLYFFSSEFFFLVLTAKTENINKYKFEAPISSFRWNNEHICSKNLL